MEAGGRPGWRRLPWHLLHRLLYADAPCLKWQAKADAALGRHNSPNAEVLQVSGGLGLVAAWSTVALQAGWPCRVVSSSPQINNHAERSPILFFPSPPRPLRPCLLCLLCSLCLGRVTADGLCSIREMSLGVYRQPTCLLCLDMLALPASLSRWLAPVWMANGAGCLTAPKWKCEAHEEIFTAAF